MATYVLQTLVMILVWLGLSLLAVSLMEYSIHCHLMHKMRFVTWLKRVFRSKPRLRDWLVKYFLDVLTHHRDFHHIECYRTTFDHAEDKGCLKSINRGNVLNELVVMAPLWLPLLFLAPMGALILIAVVAAHAVIFSAFHEEMHSPERARWFYRWQPFRSVFLCVSRYHWLHHKYPNKNFSGLFPLGFDWVFGTRAKATAEDLAEMKRIGL